ncbi:MAG: hypothetical protein ACRYGK_10215, partial [Janthinobacterium lividum]
RLLHRGSLVFRLRFPVLFFKKNSSISKKFFVWGFKQGLYISIVVVVNRCIFLWIRPITFFKSGTWRMHKQCAKTVSRMGQFWLNRADENPGCLSTLKAAVIQSLVHRSDPKHSPHAFEIRLSLRNTSQGSACRAAKMAGSMTC